MKYVELLDRIFVGSILAAGGFRVYRWIGNYYEVLGLLSAAIITGVVRTVIVYRDFKRRGL